MPSMDKASSEISSDWQHEQDALLHAFRSASHQRATKTRSWIPYIALIILTNVLSIVLTTKCTKASTRRESSADLDYILEAYPTLDRSFSLVTFSEHKINTTTQWSAPPSPEVDRAWVELGARDHGFLLPASVGSKLGMSPLEAVYDEKGKWGGDLEGYLVFNQGFHDLHCLNELRRALYFNKPYYKQYENDTVDPEWFRRSHINHCLDNVRERLMCTSDLGLIPSVYTGPNSEAMRFGNQHKCHDFQALRDWKLRWEEAHPWFLETVNKMEPFPVTPPPGAILHDPKEFS